MRKLAAAAALAAALVLPSAEAAPQPVLGIDGLQSGGRLAWFDPATLSTLPGRKVPLAGHTGAWAFSPDRARLAIASANDPSVRFVNARAMHPLGSLELRHDDAATVEGLTWARPDRLLVAVAEPASSFVAVVDPLRRRVLRRVLLPPLQQAAGAPGGLAALLAPANGFGAAKVAFVGADGGVRTTVVDRIQAGQIERPGENLTIKLKRPGFAVDPAGRRAFVVGPDFTVATVDLDTGALAYHPPGTRSLAKNISGPMRSAAWLGGGILAVAGVDFAGAEDGQQPAGLRLIDTRDWTRRVVDPAASWFDVGDGVLVGDGKVFGFDGVLRYRFKVASTQWLNVQGPYAYVCDSLDTVRRVLDLASGTTMPPTASASGACPTLLFGQSSS